MWFKTSFKDSHEEHSKAEGLRLVCDNVDDDM
jgi:hypothetical protein